MFVRLQLAPGVIYRLAPAFAFCCICALALMGCTMPRRVASQPEGAAIAEPGPGSTTVTEDANDAGAGHPSASTSNQPTTAANEQNGRVETGPEAVATASTSSHRVVAGDTLTQIAERYGVSVASLMRANDLPNPNLLTVGQIITLPAPPVDYTPAFHILPDSLLVRSTTAGDFDVDAFISSHGGALSDLTVHLNETRFDGTARAGSFSAAEIIERVSLEYSVDPRILIAFLEYAAGMLTESALDDETKQFPLRQPEAYFRMRRAGLYNQLSWLADRLNQGYYGWKYRGESILELEDGSRLYYEPKLNPGTVAVQHVLAQLPSVADWREASGEAGISATYQGLFGDPLQFAHETVPANLQQPDLTLPFPRGDVWRFTGGFHGGWGNGSAWAAVDFSPPRGAGQGGACYTAVHPTTAVARGIITRLDEGVVILDLDEDSNEGTGWTVLYLHVDHKNLLEEGQVVEAGNILGYASCLGGVTNATHLHIARRYNGEWLPADCNRCPPGVAVPPFVMSDWKVVGLNSQLYQGFMVHQLENRTAVAEQGRYTAVNEISW